MFNLFSRFCNRLKDLRKEQYFELEKCSTSNLYLASSFFFFFKLQTFFSLYCRILLELRDNYCMVTRLTGVCIYWNEILEEKFLFENLHETNISKEWRKFCLRIYFSLLIFNDLEIILKCSSYLLNEIRSPWTFRIVPKRNSYSCFCRLYHHEYVYTFYLKSTLSSNERIRRIFLPSPHE